jgi:hypothetical protein
LCKYLLEHIAEDYYANSLGELKRALSGEADIEPDEEEPEASK